MLMALLTCCPTSVQTISNCHNTTYMPTAYTTLMGTFTEGLDWALRAVDTTVLRDGAARRRAAKSFSIYNTFRVARSGFPSDGVLSVSMMANTGKKALNTRVTACLYGCLWQETHCDGAMMFNSVTSEINYLLHKSHNSPKKCGWYTLSVHQVQHRTSHINILN